MTTRTHRMPVAEYRSQMVRALRRIAPELSRSARRRLLDQHMETVTEESATRALAVGDTDGRRKAS